MTAANLDDMVGLARRRVPRILFDYLESGSYRELTLDRNRRDLDRLEIVQRVMVDVSSRSTASTIFGQPVAMPAAIAPTGMAGLFYRDGEIALARAADRVGVPYCMSTMSMCSIEEVRAMAKPFWFQLYLMRDRGLCRSLVERAAASDCPALVVTVDLAAQGVRYRDVRNGLSVPIKLRPSNLADIVSKPAWVWGMIRAKRRTFGNIADYFKDGNVGSIARFIAEQFDSSVTWKDIEWLRGIWPRKLVVKGIMDARDARAAAEAGADAIVVSNHGGRQLDGGPSTISVLPEIAQALAGEVPIFLDGGVRSGQDLFKAIASGANACLVGRAPLYALAAAGETGVVDALTLLRNELDATMALSGRPTIEDITLRAIVRKN